MWLTAHILAANIMSVGAADDENVLKLGIQINEFKLMNSLARPWYDSANFFSLTNTPLVLYQPDLDIAPGLASSWEIAPDGKSIKFSLVKNATWSDGRPVTAKDVAFSFDYWKRINFTAKATGMMLIWTIQISLIIIL